jgi:hypothetical protein
MLPAVALLLSAGLAGANVAPVIDSFTASSATVLPGGVVSLQVNAHDPDCADVCTSGCGMTVRSDVTTWSATGGTFVVEDPGTTGSPYTATADWQAPMVESTYTITVFLGDSGNFICSGRQTVTADLIIQVTSTPNNPPIVDSLTASPTQIYPGETSSLSCSASDPDGDPLSYSWSSNIGAVTPGSDGEATFTSPDPGTATITCSATDSGGAIGSADVNVVVTDVSADGLVRDGLVSPQRITIDSTGTAYVVDRAAGGLTVVHLESGRIAYRIPLPDVTAVAADWKDDLLVGGRNGVHILDRLGNQLLDLQLGGDVADVTVDHLNQRYAVLLRRSSRIVVFDAGGTQVAAFGSVGDLPEQLKSPQGLAFSPSGTEIVVGDTGHGLIKVFDLAGTLLSSFGGLGGAAGEFVQLAGIEVDGNGVIFASDAQQSRVQSFNPDGTLREVIGSWGDGFGQLKTPIGVTSSASFGKLVVASANSSSLQIFTLAGGSPSQWPAPQTGLSTSQLDFPAQALGSTSSPLGITISNTGDAYLGISDLAVDGPFTAATSCSSLSPGGSCSVMVSFTPGAIGTATGQLAITASDSSQPYTVSLSGLGFVPAQSLLSTASLSFAEQAVGSTSAPLSVQLSNGGSIAMTISSIAASEHYGLTSTCPASLPGGASCSIDVYFMPTAAGSQPGAITVTTTAAGSPHQVSLSGDAVLLDLSPAPAAIDFGTVLVNERSAVQALSLTNIGTANLQIAMVRLVGGDSHAFAIATDLCSGATLAIGASCTVQAFFEPSVRAALAADIEIATNGGPTYLVSLTGTGSAVSEPIFSDGFESGDLAAWSTTVPKGLYAFPGELKLGQASYGDSPVEQLVTISNYHDRPIYIGLIAIADQQSHSFEITADSCSNSELGRRKSCTIRVMMLTLDEGALTATIEVPTPLEEPTTMLQVPVAGTVELPGY